MSVTKTALLLYGNYNLWYLTKNTIKSNVDVFLSVYDIPCMNDICIKGILIIDKTIPDDKICNERNEYEKERFISNGKKLIDSDKYSDIIIREFNEIIPGINIVSSNTLKINNILYPIWNVSNFSSLIFGDKVCEYDSVVFTPYNNEKILFFIPSVIYTNDKNITSNIFSPEERLQQTVEQCKSIKKYVPNSVIFLLEKSAINLNEIYKLSEYTDKIVLFYNDQKCRDISLSPTKNKSIAECYVLNHMIKNIPDDNNYSHIVKFGGRYKLLDDFSIKNVISNVPIMKELQPQFMYDNKHHVDSIFYSIPKKYKNKYLNCLNDINNHVDIEHCLGYHFKDILQHVTQLRIIGTSAAGMYNMI